MDKKQTLYPESWQVPPMKYCSKVSDLAAKQAFDSGNWIAQEKKDGALYVLEKTDSGYIYLFSRTKSKKTGELVEKSDNFPHIKEWAEFNLPKGTILVGEIYIPGGHSNTVTKLSGCLPKKAQERQFDKTCKDYIGPAHYYIFDILRFQGQDIQTKPTIERLENYLWGEKINWSFKNVDFVERAITFYKDFELHLQNILNNGGEGMVFKNKQCPYRAGMRSTASQMFKWKQHLDSVDLVCVDIECPKIEYTGKEIKTWKYWIKWIDKIRCKYEILPEGCYYDSYLENPEEYMPVTKFWYNGWGGAFSLGCYKNNKLTYVGRVSSGLTDEMRANMTLHPEKYLDKVIQISCMSLDSKEGTIRHPVFEKIRTDKNPEECLWEEIFMTN